VFFYIGFGAIAGFIPPPRPTDSPAAVAEMFREDRVRILVGMLVTSFATAFYVTWSAGFAAQFKRIEGHFAVFGPAILGMGAIFSLEFIYLAFFWIVAAYRADRDPGQLQTLNDMGWVPFIGLVSTVMLMAVVMGVGMLRDDRPTPIFPRWAGYLNIWCAVMIAPGGLNIFFQTGPFAWNGLLAFWVVLIGFTIWMGTNIVVLFRAITGQEAEAVGDAGSVSARANGTDIDITALAAEVALLRAEVANRPLTNTAGDNS
jgi:hypothetical protein